MNPALRYRDIVRCGGTSLALVLALGLIAARVDARPLVSANSVPQFLQAAKRLAHTAVDEFEGPRSQSGSSAQSQGSTLPAAQSAKIADLDWLAGRWVGKWGPRTAEQVWTSPEAGLMLCAFRVFEDHHTLLVELFTLEQKEDGLELHFRHFTPDLVPWETSAAADLMLHSYDSKRWTFLNSGKGEPKRSIIIRVDSDTYTLRSEIASGTGPVRIVDITFHRQETQNRKFRKTTPTRPQP